MSNDGKKFVAPYGWVTPVKNLRGQIIYYIDSSGARVGDPLAGPGSGGPRRSASEAKAAAERRLKQQENAGKVSAEQRAIDANKALGYVWVDGKRMRIVGTNPDNSLNVTYDNGKVTQYYAPTAFDALDSDKLDGDTQFVMSNGTWRGIDGTSTQTQKPGGFTSADAADRRFNSQVGQNRMTVKSGVQWLANLSTKDPTAYAELVDKLLGANYLSETEAATAHGGFSTAVAGAFAKLARDTASVNSTEAGGNVTALDLLNQKVAATKAAQDKAEADAYKPVDRTYTDPTALAATAKSAAQQLLGRALSPEEEKAFLSKFRGLESGMYDQIDAAGRAKKGATVTTPNAAGQAEAFVNDPKYDAERGAALVGSFVDSLNRLLGG